MAKAAVLSGPSAGAAEEGLGGPHQPSPGDPPEKASNLQRGGGRMQEGMLS